MCSVPHPCTRDALQRMLDYSWPGNVRELKNAIEHAFVTVGGDRITRFDLPPELRFPPARHPRTRPEPMLTSEEHAERRRIIEALQKTGGNRSEAARTFGFSRVTLWKKMRRLGIDDHGVAGR